MKILDDEKIKSLTLEAKRSLRKRVHLCFHPTNDSLIHKLYIAAQPETYICPHRHVGNGRWELLTIIKGSGILFAFDDEGGVLSKNVLSTDGPLYSVELGENIWHAFVVTANDTVFQEIKAGPYVKPEPSDFASWAPKEGDPEVEQFLKDLKLVEL